MSAVLELPNGAHVLASEVTSIKPHLNEISIIVSHGGTLELVDLDSLEERAAHLAKLGAAWRAALGEDIGPCNLPYDEEWQHNMLDLAVALGFDPTHHPSNLIGAAIEIIERADKQGASS